MATTPTSGTPQSSSSMRTPAGGGTPTTPTAAAAAATPAPTSFRPNATLSLFGATHSSGSTAVPGDQLQPPCQWMRTMIGNTSWLPIFGFNSSGLGFLDWLWSLSVQEWFCYTYTIKELMILVSGHTHSIHTHAGFLLISVITKI
jgi:hypothetical protein